MTAPLALYSQWSAIFASYFAILGVWTAFGPGALMAQDPEEAPIALAAMTLAYFVSTPLARVVWRRLGFSTTLMIAGIGVSASLSTAALMPQWLAWCGPIAFFFGTGAYALCETQLLDDLARSGQAHSFGRPRKWGSFGFLAAASIGGAVFSVTGVGPILTGALAFCALGFLACCFVLARSHRTALAVQATEAPVAATPLLNTGVPMAPVTGARKPIGALAVTSLRLGEAIATTWFGAYWLATGHSPLQTGLLCSVPVVAEFLAMWKGGRFVARLDAHTLMLICCVVSVLRWLATPWCSELWCAVPLQSIHAFSFGFFYPASLVWLKHAYGDGFFKIRYITESLARAGTALVSFLAAQWIIARFGFTPIFIGSCVLGLLSAAWWWRVRATAPGTGDAP